MISHAIRHEPWLYELELDDEGWVDLDALIAAIHQTSPDWEQIGEPEIAEMIRCSPKKSHEIKDGHIRALYGHSVPGNFCKTAMVPPAILYHGAAPQTIPVIHREGLLPMGRQYVHLSVERNIAIAVGKRKDPDPILLTIHADQAHQSGISFYSTYDKIWLADHIPPQFIDFCEAGPGGLLPGCGDSAE